MKYRISTLILLVSIPVISQSVDLKCIPVGAAGAIVGGGAALLTITPDDGIALVAPYYEAVQFAGASGAGATVFYVACVRGDEIPYPDISNYIPPVEVIDIDNNALRPTGTEILIAPDLNVPFPIPTLEEVHMLNNSEHYDLIDTINADLIGMLTTSMPNPDWGKVNGLVDGIKIDSLATALWAEKLLRTRHSRCQNLEYFHTHKKECTNMAGRLNRLRQFLHDLANWRE